MAEQFQDAGYPFGHQGGDTPDAETGYPFGECTDAVSRYLLANFNVKIPPNLGDAWEWQESMGILGWPVNQAAQVNSIAVWSKQAYPDFGHVAVVVSTDPLQVFEMNFEYPVDQDPGHADIRTVAQSDPQPVAYGLADGVTAGANPANLTSAQTSSNGTSDPLGLGIIGQSISTAGAQVEAEAQIAAMKVQSYAMIGGGMGIMGAGGGAIVLGALGHTPQSTYQAANAQVRRASSAVRGRSAARKPDAVAASVDGRKYTNAEISWNRKERAKNAALLAQGRAGGHQTPSKAPRGGGASDRAARASSAREQLVRANRERMARRHPDLPSEAPF